MRLLVYVEAGAVRGGIEIFAERQVARLREDGCEVKVVGTRSEAEAEDFGAWDGIVVHKCPDVATLELFPPGKTTVYVHDHDPVCPRSYAYTPFGRNCMRRAGLFPCLFCAPLCRNWRPALGRVLSQSRRLAALRRVRKVVVISEFMKSRLVANGLPPEKVSVEPPTIRLPDARHTDGIGSVDLLFVGQLIRGKGVQLLLRAMAMMKSPRTLDVVGAGNMEPKLRALAARLGVADRVRWRGFQENPQDWMRAAKCVVVPSFWQEPYGLVAAEAVALGKPCVAFAIGGLPEAGHGKATLVPPGDVGALARALEEACEQVEPLACVRR